ncbi:MAG: Flagellar basal body rod protein FlgB [Firmicutes bacterium]|nr:Flagellar basal body rod protein FlgB [Bacillota bacterium]
MRVSVIDLLSRAMDAAVLRQRVVANNVANANTPGFKRSFVSFEAHVRDAIARRNVTSASFQPRVHTDKSTALREDGNNVSVDHEMVLMAANAIQFQALSQQLSDRFSMYRYVINEGRR